MLTLTTTRPYRVFHTEADAQAAIEAMDLAPDEARIIPDPKGSSRCIVDVLDPEDGAVIGRI